MSFTFQDLLPFLITYERFILEEIGVEAVLVLGVELGDLGDQCYVRLLVQRFSNGYMLSNVQALPPSLRVYDNYE